MYIAEVSGSDTPADLYRLFPVSNWRRIESGGKGSLPAKTIARGIDSSPTGLRSTTERLLVVAGSAGAQKLFLHHARQLLLCTRCALFARRDAPRSSLYLSSARAEGVE
eukprot:1471454-Pleurochrysis_carterae.AAC.2